MSAGPAVGGLLDDLSDDILTTGLLLIGAALGIAACSWYAQHSGRLVVDAAESLLRDPAP